MLPSSGWKKKWAPIFEYFKRINLFQVVQRVLMKTKRADEVYKDPAINSKHNLCSNLWLIKSPLFIAIQLKNFEKNMYSDDRPFRVGLADTPDCQICLDAETMQHQLTIRVSKYMYLEGYLQSCI